MSLQAYDVRGYLGDVGTAHGWATLAEALRSMGTEPAREFATDGYTEQPQILAAALAALSHVEGAENLAQLAGKAAGVLIVSDGVEEEE